jgi:hypothetical protein
MRRAALLLLVGIGIGAAGALYFHAHRAAHAATETADLSLPVPDGSARSSTDRVAESKIAEPRVVEALAAKPAGTVQRAALYVAAARADAREIQTLLAQAAALDRDNAARAFALDVLLTRYAELDAGAAVAAASDLDVATPTRNSLYRAWLESSPTAALSAISDLNGGKADDLWKQVAVAAPAVALDRLDAAPAQLRDELAQTALQELAKRDPQAAIDWLDKAPRGAKRQSLVRAVAWGFAQHDADGALAWARSLQPGEPFAMASAIAGIGEANPMHALDLAAETLAPLERMRTTEQIVFRAIRRDPTLTAALLERMVALPDNREMQSMMQSLVTTWAQREPAKAAEWFVSNATRAPIDVATAVASHYAVVDPTQAGSYTARLPTELRGAWLRGIAATYAAHDPGAALDWVEQFRGSPEYDDAVAAVIQSAAQIDPALAARAVESIGKDDSRRNAASTLAVNWAGRDPAAAATWAASLRDPLSQSAAVMSVAGLWASEDPAAAQAWVLAQPAGEVRDTGITMLLRASAGLGAPDASLLSALSSEQARLQVVRNTAVVIAQRDPEAARAFAAANLADRSQRDGVLLYLSKLPDRSADLVRGPGGTLFTPPGLLRIPASPRTAGEPN